MSCDVKSIQGDQQIEEKLFSTYFGEDLDSDSVTMAEAMINDKYMGARIPTLSLPSSSSLVQQSIISSPVSDTRQESNISPSRSTNKVVEFDLPAKRRKPSWEMTAQSIVAALHQSVNQKDRLKAIYTACATFDHNIEAVHNDEIAVAADAALAKHLSLLILLKDKAQNSSQKESRSERYVSPFSFHGSKEELLEEIGDTCAALEMVLRCSADSVSFAFQRIGAEVLPIIIHEIQERLGLTEVVPSDDPSDFPSSMQQQMDNDNFYDNSGESSSKSSVPSNEPEDNQAAADDVFRHVHGRFLKSTTKIIAHFARVGSITETLASMKGMLPTLQNIISSSDRNVPIEAKLNSLWILANLACSEGNMVMMARNPSLIDSIVKVALRPSETDEKQVQNIIQYLELLRSRSIAVRAILNLSWAHENKIQFTARTDLVLSLLDTARHRSSMWSGRGKGVSGILLQSRRHAAGALRNLAAAPRRFKKTLCKLESGDFLEHLAEIAMNDPDSIVKAKAHATLFNLVSADTAKLFTRKKDVLDIIAREAMSSSTDEKEESGDSAQTFAKRTLRTLEKAIPSDEEGYTLLKPLLKKFDSRYDSAVTLSSISPLPI